MVKTIFGPALLLIKNKLMAWLITHRMRFLVVVFDKLRVLLRR